MSTNNQHAEWLSLLDISGPFLAVPVLEKIFPQGLEKLASPKRKKLNQAYEEWLDAIDNDDVELPEIHREWVNLVLEDILELADDEEDSLIASELLPEKLQHSLPEYDITLKPDYAFFDEQSEKYLLLIKTFEPGYDLNAPSKGDGWTASATERMVQLCRATDVRLGLITNGEQWMLIDAPVGAVTTFASWFARIWQQEPVTLQAFEALLGVRRFFVDSSEQLPALLDESIKHQDEVTDALGEQVRRAVEVLVQALDKADLERNRQLLKDVQPTELYEAGLTVMMRLVFLLCAEERELLLLGDERFEAHYAVSTLRMQLKAESEEILERRWDGWARLLAIFRAVYGGVEHEGMQMPALGGSLFDPDRFPFLEGRAKGSSWKFNPAKPLPIDNRTVLLLLDSIQLFQGRTLSYRALDVEQIGYVYEGLLERTVKKAIDVTLELDATKNSKKPWLTLGELESARLDGKKAVEELLKERTGSSISRVRNDLNKKVEDAAADKLLTACNSDIQLRDRLLPVFHLLKTDSWGYPLVYPKGAYMVAMGADRRETGSHYTPKSLTESIVKETLEPVAYIGPAEGKERADWQLKSPSELLDLKVCDPAMGSGAFLVQVCRWLSERLVEAWEVAEKSGKIVSSEGEVLEAIGKHEPLSTRAEERLLTARRLIAERCLYGVDMNPLAVELAKLSIWLVTLAKGRPFGFLDHNLRHGDSLLGIQNLDQLLYLNMDTGSGQKQLFAQKIELAVHEAIELRKELRLQPIRDIKDVEVMAHLDAQAREKLMLPELIADALIGLTLKDSGNTPDTAVLSIHAGEVLDGNSEHTEQIQFLAEQGLSSDLPLGKPQRRPFHWMLEFPEVFGSGKHGFDAIVGNPPFLGGQKITGVSGTKYREYLVEQIASGIRGSADLVSYFFLKAHSILSHKGCFGLLAVNTIAEGDTRDVGLGMIRKNGGDIYSAYPNEPWPGNANVITSRVHISSSIWNGKKLLNGSPVTVISDSLSERVQWKPVKLNQNSGKVYQGSIILGLGFTMDQTTALRHMSDNPELKKILFPYLIGKEVNRSPTATPERYVINFWDWSEEESSKFAPSIFAQVQQEVLPERLNQKDKGAKQNWWLHLRSRPELYHLIGRGGDFKSHPKTWKNDDHKLSQVMVFATGATKYPCFTIVPNEYIYANTLCVVTSDSFSLFATLSSDIHGVWAWEQGSRMKQDLRYTHGDIFETFPLPREVGKNLEKLGQNFFNSRKNYMVAHNKGMTKFYNDLHNPDIDSEEINALRILQTKLNTDLLALYDWSDLDLEHDFHEVAYLPEGKNLRYTISEKAREEVLYRLAMLNKARHEEEIKEGLTQARTKKVPAKKAAKPKDSKPKDVPQIGLFEAAPQTVTKQKAAKGNQWGATPTDQIYAWLEGNQGKWYSKQVILNGCGAAPAKWDDAIAELLADGDIEQQGSGDNLRYRAKV